ncbi:MAG TPA: hypothetical protein VNJ07_11470, partial [Chitinophagales bacterium]|nr:hypothetical protein [Chitinophagales bacterium]
ETYAYKEAAKFYRIIVEEISDRVVIKILNGIQREIASDSPVTENLVTEVLKPHQHEIAQWMSHRIRTVTEHNYNIYRDDLKNYIEDAIGGAVKQNKEIQKIGSIPIVGRQISSGLEQGVSDITFEAINGLLTGLSSEKNTKVIEDFINAMFESILAQEKDQKLNRLIKDIFIGALDKIKEQVKRKKWQEDDKETAVAA